MIPNEVIPVILFAYARPDHLQRTLDSLRENNVPLIYAFSDAARTPDKEDVVNQVRQMLRQIDWADVVLCEREQNLGLGRSILTGVSEVLQKHEAVIVFEDDLICVPGTYDYLSQALIHYANDDRVMSVTGWTHPRVTPSNAGDQPYFDGRAECWVWGTWRRSWQGMEKDASTLITECRQLGIDPYKYGADLMEQARLEKSLNIWAVRFLYLHIRQGKLALRPPWSMVEHIGFDSLATNAGIADGWDNAILRPVPPIPSAWSESVENKECAILWQKAYGHYRWKRKAQRYIVNRIKRILRWIPR